MKGCSDVVETKDKESDKYDYQDFNKIDLVMKVK